MSNDESGVSCERLEYVGINGLPAFCMVYAMGNTVVAHEVATNTGMSVTNASEIIATEVCKKYCIRNEDLEMYEYYIVNGKISLSRVTFPRMRSKSFGVPDWAPVEVAAFEQEHFPLALLGNEDSYFVIQE